LCVVGVAATVARRDEQRVELVVLYVTEDAPAVVAGELHQGAWG
jgi:hypothetical protein